MCKVTTLVNNKLTEVDACTEYSELKKELSFDPDATESFWYCQNISEFIDASSYGVESSFVPDIGYCECGITPQCGFVLVIDKGNVDTTKLKSKATYVVDENDFVFHIISTNI